MNKITLTAILMVAIGFVTGCNQSNENNGQVSATDGATPEAISTKTVPDIDGFKDAKFGTPLSEMESLGYYCYIDKLDGLDMEFDVCTKESTLFGLPARVEAHFDDKDVLYTVEVRVVDSKPIDLINLFTNAIGQPRLFEERSAFDLSTTKTSMWLSPLGSSILIFRHAGMPGTVDTVTRKLENNGGKPFDGMAGTQYEQRAVYYNAPETKNLLKKLEATKVTTENDF